MISALKLVTNLIQGNKLGVAVNSFTESRKDGLAEAFDSFSVYHHG